MKATVEEEKRAGEERMKVAVEKIKASKAEVDKLGSEVAARDKKLKEEQKINEERKGDLEKKEKVLLIKSLIRKLIFF